jgi:hypothetical protein
MALEGAATAPAAHGRDTSLFTILGVVEGEILDSLETYRRLSLRRLIQGLGWPSNLIVMATGALIREGLARGYQHELEIVLEGQERHVQPCLVVQG